MKRSSSKLVAAGFLLLVAMILMVSVSYAWFTLAGSPALTGIQINIAVSNTIKVAPDVTQTVDGETVHYPGAFSETLSIVDDENYEYLKELIGLTPVSTADGIHWFMPPADLSMGSDLGMSLSDYAVDETLAYANLTDAEAAEQGSYIYLDFWVVSPMDSCTLRVSIGDSNEGSYLIGLPAAEKDSESEIGYVLNASDDDAAACARVGFLANTTDVTGNNNPMIYYSNSDDYNSKYSKLRGIYQEAGNTVSDDEEYQFMIYEPNGLKHNNAGVSYVQTKTGLVYRNCEDGDYAVTTPLGYENGEVVLKNIRDILAVQKTNRWKTAENGDMFLSQIFTSNMMNQDLEGKSEDEITELFYGDILQNRYSDYVEREMFFADTKELYTAAAGSVATADDLTFVETDTATTTAAIVSLERDVPQRIRMYVWLEGQDIDCVREAALECFALEIELAGSTQK